jgi:hypothetical protein
MSSFNPRFSQQALALHVDAEWLGGDVPFICDDCDVKSSWLRPGRGARPDNLAPGVRDGNCAHNADAIGFRLVSSVECRVSRDEEFAVCSGQFAAESRQWTVCSLQQMIWVAVNCQLPTVN